MIESPVTVAAPEAAASSLIALAERAPLRARAAMAAALSELAPEDWAFLGLVYRGHAHSPTAALARVLAVAAARLGTDVIDPLDQRSSPATAVETIEVPAETEIRDALRGPVRADCYDLRPHADPAPAATARTTGEQIATITALTPLTGAPTDPDDRLVA